MMGLNLNMCQNQNMLTGFSLQGRGFRNVMMEELQITVSRDVCIPLNMTDSDIICRIDRYPFASFMSPSVKVCIFFIWASS